MKNVLIVDNDLEFVCWLGKVLIGADYQPWPACSVSDAINLVGGTPEVPLDILIINPRMRGASRLIEIYQRAQTRLKVMALGDDHRHDVRVGAWRAKPGNEARMKEKWIRAVNRIARSHKRAA